MSIDWKQRRDEPDRKAVAMVGDLKVKVEFLENRFIWAFVVQGTASSMKEAMERAEAIFAKPEEPAKKTKKKR